MGKDTENSYLITTAKVVMVVCAFIAFGLSLRQQEFSRFGDIKPIFEIVSIDDHKFSVCIFVVVLN